MTLEDVKEMTLKELIDYIKSIPPESEFIILTEFGEEKNGK